MSVRHVITSGLTVGALLGTSLLLSAPVSAAPPPIVKIAVVKGQATISQSTMRPGVVEFHVGNTFPIPEDQGGGADPVSIVRTDQLDRLLTELQTVLTADPGDPVSLAASAAGMRAAHAISTWYGGAQKGGVWQVNLPVGNYYALGLQTTVLNGAKAVPFTVAGSPRAGSLHATQMTIRAVGPVGNNKWTFRQVATQRVEWISFANAAHEIHFMAMAGVKPITTDAMVERGYMGNSLPKWETGPFNMWQALSRLRSRTQSGQPLMLLDGCSCHEQCLKPVDEGKGVPSR